MFSLYKFFTKFYSKVQFYKFYKKINIICFKARASLFDSLQFTSLNRPRFATILFKSCGEIAISFVTGSQ